MDMVSPREAAERLSVATITIRRLIDAGHLPAYKVGKAVRIPVDAIEGYLESRKVGGAA